MPAARDPDRRSPAFEPQACRRPGGRRGGVAGAEYRYRSFCAGPRSSEHLHHHIGRGEACLGGTCRCGWCPITHRLPGILTLGTEPDPRPRGRQLPRDLSEAVAGGLQLEQWTTADGARRGPVLGQRDRALGSADRNRRDREQVAIAQTLRLVGREGHACGRPARPAQRPRRPPSACSSTVCSASCSAAPNTSQTVRNRRATSVSRPAAARALNAAHASTIVSCNASGSRIPCMASAHPASGRRRWCRA